MKLVILPTAREDINHIHEYIGRDNLVAADAMIEAILDSIDRLAGHPRMGRISARDADVRELVISPFLVLYTIDSEAVRVLQVIHGARDFLRH